MGVVVRLIGGRGEAKHGNCLALLYFVQDLLGVCHLRRRQPEGAGRAKEEGRWVCVQYPVICGYAVKF